MKILLREYCSERYVWKTAKYKNGKFYVDEEPEPQCNIVSIVNDNRKNYIQCSCCGQVFRRGDRRFQMHKENASKPETCFGCSHLCESIIKITANKYIVNPDGSFSQKIKRNIVLKCDRTGVWTYSSINSERAINQCSKRQCKNATEMEIIDFFTRYPGAFDDIITVDRLLDEGYSVGVRDGMESTYDIMWEDDYTIGVLINRLGIIDRFYIWYGGEKYTVFYSKKYDELFYNCGEYVMWNILGLDNNIRNEIKTKIAKLYY